MTLPTQDTVVTYPAGATSGAATVVHVEPIGDRPGDEFGDLFAVLLDTTPVHPVDAGWPDQPADRASFEWNGGSANVVDCVVAATDGTQLFLGSDIPVRKGTEGWAFVVAHLVEQVPPEGIVVTVRVDDKFRRAISAGHTACHLAALALNLAMASRWSKDVAPDALGAPNFDAEANDTSRILEHGSRDTYRLGKSLRKKGFNTENLSDELTLIEDVVNAALTEWIAAKSPVRIDRKSDVPTEWTETKSPVRVDRDGDRLTDRRYWVCEFPEGEARIPCGGTHVGNLSEIKGLKARLSLEDHDGTPVLVMETSTN